MYGSTRRIEAGSFIIQISYYQPLILRQTQDKLPAAGSNHPFISKTKVRFSADDQVVQHR